MKRSLSKYLALCFVGALMPIMLLAKPSPKHYDLKPIMDNAYQQTVLTTNYDPSYQSIAYPNGDVNIRGGICVDVIIRAFRAVNIDLQKLIHEDMQQHFKDYPKWWGLKKPDSNIDHRRVPNLVTYLERHNKTITPTQNQFQPGDIVVWRLPVGLLHVGLVSDRKDKKGQYLVFHNIAEGAKLENVLHEWKIIGHYRI